MTGAGAAFSPGQDPGDAAALDAGPGSGGFEATLNAQYVLMICAITDAPMPVIAAVNGVAAGAGVNLALACGLVDCL